MQITGHHLISGRPSAANKDGPSFRSLDPTTLQLGEISFCNASYSEINEAVEAAVDAFKTTRLFSSRRLAGLLESIALNIEEVAGDLIRIARRESGLGVDRLSGELARTTGQIRKFGALLEEGSYVEAIIDLPTAPSQPDIRRMLFPIGPVAVFTASNFPLAFGVAGGDTASAFAAGCPVIVKAHPSQPETSEFIAHQINLSVADHGFPSGFFSLLQGNEIRVSEDLVLHPGIAAVGFTGSLPVGRSLYDLAATRKVPIPVYAEMGSINPVIVLPGAVKQRMDTLAEQLAESVTRAAGQFCTNPGLIIIFKDQNTDVFLERLAKEISDAPLHPMLNGNIHKNLQSTVERSIRITAVDPLVGGQAVDGDGYCFANTLLSTDADTFMRHDGLQDEHFGPVTLAVICDDHEQVNAIIDRLSGNLTATIHGESEDTALASSLFELLREKVGRLIWNGVPTGVEVVYAMHHGGPYPATTSASTTSVGMTAVKRFMRPVAMQNLPDEFLPDALRNANPLGIWRIINTTYSQDPIHT